MTRKKLRRYLDDWRFWMGIAYFGLVLVTVALWINYDRVSADTARTIKVEAARHADIVANADAQYTQCVESIPTLRHVNDFIVGVAGLEQALLKNNIAAHQATPPTTPLYAAQILNIARLRVAIRSAKQVAFTVPTKATCVALRDSLTTRN